MLLKQSISSSLFKRYPKKTLFYWGHSATLFKNHNIVIKSMPVHAYQYKNEYETLQALNNKHIIKPLDCYEEQQKFNIVYPYYKNGDMYSFLSRTKTTPTKEQILVIMKKLIQPIIYLHTNNYVHLDLKFENILIQDNYQKKTYPIDTYSKLIENDILLIDFEFSKKLEPNYYKLHKTKYKSGTNLYRVPQLDKYLIGFTSDIYSLGLMFFILKNTRLPNKNDLIYQPDFKLYPDIDDIISLMLAKDHKDRPTIYQIEYFINKNIELLND